MPPRAMAVIAASMLGLSVTPAASAANPGEQIPTLSTIEVIATSISAPLTVTTDPKQPRQPLPASDGADYLQTIPGFTAIRSGGTNGDLVLRGMFGSRLNIESNGVPTLGACPARMDAPTSYIAPETYDKVSVIKGPQSVRHGPGASAGTVLFERNTKPFDAPGIRFDGSLVGGSFGRNDQNADLSVGNQSMYARVTANHAHQQDYKDGNDLTVPSQWDKWNADAAIGLTPDAHTQLELSAGAGDGYARYAGRSMDGAQFKRDSFGLHLDKRHIGEVLDRIEARIYANDSDHVMDNYTLRTPAPGGMMTMQMASNIRRRMTGGNVAATWRWSDQFELVGGADIQTSRIDKRAQMGSMSYTDMPWQPTTTMRTTGVFGELTWYANDTQRMIGGARLDRSSALDQRAVIGKGVNPTTQNTRENTLPSGFLRYEQDIAGNSAMWYAGLGHVERFPDYWELFSPSLGPAGSVNAFSSIQPEKTTQIDIGAQYKSEALDLWVSGYAGTVQDFILFRYPAVMGSALSQASNVDARIMGGELGGAWRAAPFWNITGSLNHAWGRNQDSGKPLPQIPPLEARLGVEYARDAWSVGGLWRVVAAQNRVALNEGNVVGKDFGPSAGFGVLSVHAQYALSKTAKLAVGIDNLLDKAYSEHLNMAGNAGFGYPASTPINNPGRTAWVRLSMGL